MVVLHLVLTNSLKGKIMKNILTIFLVSITLLSCTSHKSIYKAKVVGNNDVVDFKQPQGLIETTNTGNLVFILSPFVGATIGYYQNTIIFFPDAGQLNRYTGAVLGGVTGVMSSYIYYKIMGHGDKYIIYNNKELELKWLSKLDTNLKYIKMYGDPAHYNYAHLLAIPKQNEFSYNIYGIEDYKYFALAFPNSSESKKIITKSFDKLGLSIAKDIKLYYPNEEDYIHNEHLSHCLTIQDCYDFAVQNEELFSVADQKANSLATDRGTRYQYLHFFSEGNYTNNNKIKIMEEEYELCQSIECAKKQNETICFILYAVSKM
ncbi:MAG: hypothetical protein QG635_1266, partial [Bacteroidota bacterium]|nr:hypothetical protein [Bacteroidota bacterium]